MNWINQNSNNIKDKSKKMNKEKWKKERKDEPIKIYEIITNENKAKKEQGEGKRKKDKV